MTFYIFLKKKQNSKYIGQHNYDTEFKLDIVNLCVF